MADSRNFYAPSIAVTRYTINGYPIPSRLSDKTIHWLMASGEKPVHSTKMARQASLKCPSKHYNILPTAQTCSLL